MKDTIINDISDSIVDIEGLFCQIEMIRDTLKDVVSDLHVVRDRINNNNEVIPEELTHIHDILNSELYPSVKLETIKKLLKD